MVRGGTEMVGEASEGSAPQGKGERKRQQRRQPAEQATLRSEGDSNSALRRSSECGGIGRAGVALAISADSRATLHNNNDSHLRLLESTTRASAGASARASSAQPYGHHTGTLLSHSHVRLRLDCLLARRAGVSPMLQGKQHSSSGFLQPHSLLDICIPPLASGDSRNKVHSQQQQRAQEWRVRYLARRSARSCREVSAAMRMEPARSYRPAARCPLTARVLHDAQAPPAAAVWGGLTIRKLKDAPMHSHTVSATLKAHGAPLQAEDVRGVADEPPPRPPPRIKVLVTLNLALCHFVQHVGHFTTTSPSPRGTLCGRGQTPIPAPYSCFPGLLHRRYPDVWLRHSKRLSHHGMAWHVIVEKQDRAALTLALIPINPPETWHGAIPSNTPAQTGQVAMPPIRA
ncbi:hypothetical protein NA57DRAFT_51126 [Rhizodiscina lignyota]|uniref:Uncharacterized protein n=1 Tax=Rhizodiscina lignyota TaxID=1504668 RepID=A0A9P4MG93_9PEZI|nr:hypothetical protein NA57DRAFT_51126 [Rhizodiscina lignyota]